MPFHVTTVLYLVSRLRPSGPTNQLYYLLKYLDDEFDPIVLTLSPEPPDTELPRFQELGVQYETWGLSRLKGLIYGSKRLRSAVKKYDPDIIQTQGIRADTLSAMFLRGYPRITTVRNYPYDDYPAKFGDLQGKAMAWEHLRMYKQIDHPIACSETIAELIDSHGVETEVIHNGVDQHKFTPSSADERRQLREKLDLPQDREIIISVGSLISRKDPQTLIKGFQKSKLDATLVFLGDGPLREECESLAADDVRFEGHVDNVSEYLQASDYFASASTSEGLPNCVMEALATGLPVCLSDIKPHLELLRDVSVGTMFPVESVVGVSEALVELVDAESDKESQSRAVVEDHFTAKKMSENYQTLYQRIK